MLAYCIEHNKDFKELLFSKNLLKYRVLLFQGCGAGNPSF